MHDLESMCAEGKLHPAMTDAELRAICAESDRRVAAAAEGERCVTRAALWAQMHLGLREWARSREATPSPS